MNDQRVVCAANRLKDGTIILGIRHWDHLMVNAFENILAAADEVIDTHRLEVELIEGHEQGFVDQWGVFLTRKEAWIIAEKNGQIVRSGPGFSGPDLYSENLY